MTYDRGVLEIVLIGPLRAFYTSIAKRIVSELASHSGVAERSMGSTTWGCKKAKCGIDADASFYLSSDKIELANAMLARKSNNSMDYPRPNLAIEVDLSRPEVDRSAVYAVIGVAEVWRFNGSSVSIDQLSPDMTYVSAEASRFLGISAGEIRRWLAEENSDDLEAWEDRLADRARMRFLTEGSSNG